MLFRALLSLAPLLALGSAYSTLSDDTLKQLPSPGKDFDIKNGAILAPILRTRVSGTPANAEVLQHFVDFFKKELPDWRLEFHNSTSTTPVSKGAEIPFRNLIATRDPPGSREGDVGRLAMVAHYDSKLTPEGFIGAIDSAAPCAMLLHAARSIDKALTRKWEAAGDLDDLDEPQGVQILLLDGEEAFAQWTDEDSIYGARALASEWEHTYHPAMSTFKTPLDSIDLFVLLDLLGSAGPKIPSYFKTTHWAYKNMATIEKRLRGLKVVRSSPNHPDRMAKRKNKKPRTEPYFLTEADKGPDDPYYGGAIGDDHVPFLARGVEILHVIPSPFPDVWHNIIDDGEHLDMDTVEDWTRIVTAFMAEWMDLEGHFDFPKTEQKREVIYEEKTELEIP